MKVGRITMFLDAETVLDVRPNRLFVVYRLTGERREHAHLGSTVHVKHVIGRGRVVGAEKIKLMRGEISVPALRKLLKDSGHDNIKVTR